MTSDAAASDTAAGDAAPVSEAGGGRRNLGRLLIGLLVFMLIVDVLALIVVPPFPPGGRAGGRVRHSRSASSTAPWSCRLPTSSGAPPSRRRGLVIYGGTEHHLHAADDVDRGRPAPACHRGHDPRWRGDAGSAPELRGVGLRVARGLRHVAWEARPRVATCPIFVSFFLLILLFNWSGLVPPVGQGRVPAGPHE